MTEVERLKRALLAVSGCTNCKACQEVALGLVGSPWRPLEEALGSEHA